MATYMGTPYQSDFQGRPPRISAQDEILWDAWRPTINARIERMWFDVGLGTGAPIPPNTPDELASMWTRNTQKRADVIIETADELWIVELRDHATSSAIGRLLQYKLLWDLDPTVKKPVRLILVSNARDTDLAALAAQSHVDYLTTAPASRL